jgi:tRNA(Ile)-lysidine synthase
MGNKQNNFPCKLQGEWLRLGLARDTRVVVAVSGGADSVALLLALNELLRGGRLALELRVAHLDHGLRGEEGAAEARAVGDLARRLGYECETGVGRVAERARETGDNLEQAARRERYEFLARVAREFDAEAVATGHTLDDQAETVLLALMRGSGAEGLGGMRAVRRLEEPERGSGVVCRGEDALRRVTTDGRGAGVEAREEGGAIGPGVLLVRPLLGWARRTETLAYCEARGVAVASDPMNEDERFARVRVRRRLLPLLETFNPRAVEAIARAAALLREDSAALEAEAAELLSQAVNEGAPARLACEGDSHAPPLRVGVLAAAPAAVRGRALRRWLAGGRGDLRRIESVHVRAVERLLGGVRGGRVAELPGGSRVERRRGWLFFRGADK